MRLRPLLNRRLLLDYRIRRFYGGHGHVMSHVWYAATAIMTMTDSFDVWRYKNRLIDSLMEPRQ